MRLGDFHLPDGWQVNAEDPTWKAGKEFAHKNGLSQDQFAGIARLYIQAQIDAHSRDETVLTAQLKARDEALGANGAARVDALNSWFRSMAEPKVADQLSKTLWTPDIVGFYEKIQHQLTNQGTVSFRQDGRKDGGRTDGRPEGWEQMSALDQRTWNLANRR
jgi:hypothetical protein